MKTILLLFFIVFSSFAVSASETLNVCTALCKQGNMISSKIALGITEEEAIDKLSRKCNGMLISINSKITVRGDKYAQRGSLKANSGYDKIDCDNL